MQTIEAMDQPLETLVKKRMRGGKAGKRTRLRELHGYVSPTVDPNSPPAQKRKLSEAKAPQKGKGKGKAQAKGKTKSEAQSAPRGRAESEASDAPRSKHAKGKAKGEAAIAPQKPVTVYSNIASDVLPRFGSHPVEESEAQILEDDAVGKSLPSTSSRARLTPAVAPPWLATSAKSTVKPAKAPVTLLPTTKAKPKPQALPWREQPEFAELLQKQQTEADQEDRIKARREIRKRLSLIKPKGTAGLSSWILRAHFFFDLEGEKTSLAEKTSFREVGIMKGRFFEFLMRNF
jgi:hypothetical protein